MKDSFTVLGKDQRGFLKAALALISMGSLVKGLIPFPARRAFTFFRLIAPMIGNEAR